MRKLALLLTTALWAPSALGATCGTAAPSYAATAGGFGVLDGQMYTPDGKPFTARGVNVIEGSQPSAAQLQAAFPGVNFVRLAIFDYASAASLKPYVDQLTAAGIVVEIEDHHTSDGSNAGGGQGTVFTGALLARELAWDKDLGDTFGGDPYVWYGEDNEPPANPSMAALGAWQLQAYQAIRATGASAPILIDPMGGGIPSMANAAVALSASQAAQMTNVVYDLHFYGWSSNFSTDQGTVTKDLQAFVSSSQNVKDADGTVPVLIGEYGAGGQGNAVAPNGPQTVQAVASLGLSGAAWAWGQPDPANSTLNGDGSLTSFGKQVAAYIAQSGPVGCAVSPIATPVITAAFTAAQHAVDAANDLTVSDVATLAAKGLDAVDQAIGDIAKVASADAGGPAGGTLSTDPATAAVLASAPPRVVAAPARTVASPTGTMPVPAPVSNSVTFSASGDGQTVVPPPGNATGTVSGAGDTVNATGGIQTITVTGPGNTVTTGPYNDTITVQSSGNTINAGCGLDTVVLAYGGKAPAAAINADLPALPPLAGAGNTFVVPAPGTGTLTLDGTLAANDRIDLTKALAGTTWDGRASTMLGYVGLASTSSGCTISVGGQVVAKLPNGSPGADVIPLLTASH